MLLDQVGEWYVQVMVSLSRNAHAHALDLPLCLALLTAFARLGRLKLWEPLHFQDIWSVLFAYADGEDRNNSLPAPRERTSK